MNHLRLALVFAFTLNISHSQTTIGNFEDIIFEKENSIDLKATNGMVKIEFCSPSIVRFRTSWDGFFEPIPFYFSHYKL